MKNRAKRDVNKSSKNNFFLNAIEFDNEFAGLIKQAREDCQLPFSIEDDEFLKQQEKKLFYWIGVIQETYNLPIHWATSLWKYITEGQLPNPGVGISFNLLRSFTHTKNRFEPLEITIYEHVSIENIKDWLDEHKQEINYHLRTLPHQRRSMGEEALMLEILDLHFNKHKKPREIAKYYSDLDLGGKRSKDKDAKVTPEYVSNP